MAAKERPAQEQESRAHTHTRVCIIMRVYIYLYVCIHTWLAAKEGCAQEGEALAGWHHEGVDAEH